MPESRQSPFEEAIERICSNTWLFHYNNVHFAAVMTCGGDFGVFAEGCYHVFKHDSSFLRRP